MPNHSAVAIANEFLRLRGSDAWPKQMEIQKLVYIAHGWNLAINGRPLVDEQPEAWDNGPVYRSLWDHIRDHWYSGPNCTLIDPDTKKQFRARLTDDENQVIERVFKRYSRYSASELSKRTHEIGTPWYQAYFGRGRNAPLKNGEIRQHYTELAMAGRGQR